VIVPGIGTTESERRVRGLPPVLYMSAYSRDEIMDRGLIDPARSFLQKPFTAQELIDLVGQELEASAGARGGRVTT
jgi:CheY-like chemotaxis protein